MSVFLNEKVIVRTGNKLEAAEKLANKIVKTTKAGGSIDDDVKSMMLIFTERFNCKSISLTVLKDRKWINKRKRSKDRGRNTESPFCFYTPIDLFGEFELIKSEKTKTNIALNEDYSFKTKTRKIKIFTDYESLAGLENGGQLIAILLHEIGHNYYELSASARIGFVLGGIAKLFMFVVSVAVFALVTFPLVIFMWLVKAILTEGLTVDILNTVIQLPLNVIDSVLDIPGDSIIVLVGEAHKQEEFADAFVTLNGYSQFMDVFLTAYKDSYKEDQTASNMASRSINNMVMVWFSLFYTHPALRIRISNQVTILKSELSLATSKEEKDFIKSEIRVCEEVLSEYENEVSKRQLVDLNAINSIIETVKSNGVFYGYTYEDLKTRIDLNSPNRTSK